jgi:hypothetical protein
MKSDAGNAAPVRPDAQRDLLAHRSTGHEDGCLFPQNPGNFLFKPGNDFPFAIVVRLLVSANTAGQVFEYLIGGRLVVPDEEACASAFDVFPIAAVNRIAPFSRKAEMPP